MARTVLSIITPQGPHPGTVAADALDFAFTASDDVNGNEFAHTGKELILIQNIDAGPQTFTATSVPDPQNRSMDITTYSVGAAEFAALLATAITGWRQTDGNFYLDSSDANILFAIMRLP